MFWASELFYSLGRKREVCALLPAGALESWVKHCLEAFIYSLSCPCPSYCSPWTRREAATGGPFSFGLPEATGYFPLVSPPTCVSRGSSERPKEASGKGRVLWSHLLALRLLLQAGGNPPACPRRHQPFTPRSG